jgi:autotransporter-associated beta strand protein
LLSGTGTVLNNSATAATVAVGNNNASTTFSGVLQNGTSALQLTKLGTGTLTLTGANTCSGGTTISAGTLQLGNGGTTGSVTGNIIDNGVLALNRSDSLTFGGVISSTGSLVKQGAGTLTLPGNNTYLAQRQPMRAALLSMVQLPPAVPSRASTESSAGISSRM